jgi:hypothetical protein
MYVMHNIPWICFPNFSLLRFFHVNDKSTKIVGADDRNCYGGKGFDFAVA